MKRTPLARKSRLRAGNKPLRRTPIKRQKWNVPSAEQMQSAYDTALAAMLSMPVPPFRLSPLVRSKPLQKRGARAKREEKALAHFRKVVLAAGQCLRCSWRPDDRDPSALSGTRIDWVTHSSGPRKLGVVRCNRGPLDPHHMNKRRGKTPEEKHDPNKGACLCRVCHDEITFGTPPDKERWFL